MSNIIDYVKDLDVPIEETIRINCPSCNSYKTFTVTNNMGTLVWNCYKASCKISGGTRVHLTADDIRKSLGFTAEETHAVTFHKPEWIVKDYKAIKPFTDKWGLDGKQLGLLYDVKEHRVVFPVIQADVMVDATGRSLGAKIPKWKRYGNGDLPYSFGSGSVAVVVEDCVSAAIVGATDSGVFTGVAVLGTSLGEGHKRYLTQFSTAIIALDPDALPKTLAFAKELRGHVSNVKVLRLTDDLKYRNPIDVDALHKIIATGE